MLRSISHMLLLYSNEKSYLEIRCRGEKTGARLTIMYQKKKGLVTKRENSVRMYVIETKIVSRRAQNALRKKGGLKNAPNLQ
jgi:hypothetical protein